MFWRKWKIVCFSSLPITTLSLRFPERNIYPNDGRVSLILLQWTKSVLKNLTGLRVERLIFKVSGGSNTKPMINSFKVYNFQQISRVVKSKRMRRVSETCSMIMDRWGIRTKYNRETLRGSPLGRPKQTTVFLTRGCALHSPGSGWRPVGGSYRYSYERSDFITGEKFLEVLSFYNINKNPLPWFSYLWNN